MPIIKKLKAKMKMELFHNLAPELEVFPLIGEA